MPASGFSTTSLRVVVDLVAQPALGQGHVQHHTVGFLLLHRRQGSAQAVQLIQIDRKADGTSPGGELLHQQVVASAFQQGAGQGFQIARTAPPACSSGAAKAVSSATAAVMASFWQRASALGRVAA